MSPLSSLTRLLDFLYSLGLHKSFVVVFISYFFYNWSFFLFSVCSCAPCTLPIIPCTRVVSLMLFLMKYLLIPKRKRKKESKINSKLKPMVCL